MTLLQILEPVSPSSMPAYSQQGATDFYGALASIGDGSYATTSISSTSGDIRFEPFNPPIRDDAHEIRIRHKITELISTPDSTPVLTVLLYAGGELVWESDPINPDESFGQDDLAIPETAIAAITDYSDLSVRLRIQNLEPEWSLEVSYLALEMCIRDRGWGVAHEDIADTKSGILYGAGAYSFAKAAGTAVAQGQPLWWDAGNSRVSFVPTGTPPLGTAREAAASGATSVVVDLNVMPPPVTGTVDISAAQAAANSNDGQVVIDTGWGVAPTSVQTSLRAVTTGRVKSAYDVLKMSGADLGKVSVSGVAAGTQLDEGDVLDYTIHL